MAIDVCAAIKTSLARETASYTLVLNPSLLSEISVVLLAERVKAEFETSAHKPTKVHVSKQGFNRVHKLLCQPHQHLALVMVVSLYCIKWTKPVVL